MPLSQHGAIVIGAGVAGLSTALYLQRAGVAVTVIDPLPPAGGGPFRHNRLFYPDIDGSVPVPPVSGIAPLPLAAGTSFGNAGLPSPATAVPIALPGMLRKVPGWLLNPLGPLSVKPGYFPRALPWLLRWIGSGR